MPIYRETRKPYSVSDQCTDLPREARKIGPGETTVNITVTFLPIGENEWKKDVQCKYYGICVYCSKTW